jgi:RNA polymerase sigma-70 factor (ECF subfamily)
MHQLRVAGALDWAAVYSTHAPELVRYLRRVVRDPETARDLVQETFARAMGAANLPPTAHLRPWLYRIATNLAISALRRRRLTTLLGSEPQARSDDQSDEADLVRRALASIPPDQAVALVLQLHEGFSRREIAEMMHISEEAIKSRVARGRLNFAAAYGRIQRGAAR